jgi:hypothetical protein
MDRNRVYALFGVSILGMIVLMRIAMAVLGMDVHFRWNR